jgi:hypothetical protein
MNVSGGERVVQRRDDRHVKLGRRHARGVRAGRVAALAVLAADVGQEHIPAAPLEEHRSADFLLAAREHGLDSKLVGELRDAGIRLAIEAEGRPVQSG